MKAQIENLRIASAEDRSAVRARLDIRLKSDNDCVVIYNAKIVDTKYGLKLFMPSIKHDGKFAETCCIESQQLHRYVEAVAMQCYKQKTNCKQKARGATAVAPPNKRR